MHVRPEMSSNVFKRFNRKRVDLKKKIIFIILMGIIWCFIMVRKRNSGF